MLFECNILQADDNRQYLVEAGNFGQAEQKFNEYARLNIAGDYELTSINRSHSNGIIANRDKVVNVQDITPQQRRIGFNAVNLGHYHTTEQPTFQNSDFVITF